MFTELLFLDGYSIEEILSSSYDLGTWYHAKNIDLIPLSFLGSLLDIGSY